jgi:hypothetical protein
MLPLLMAFGVALGQFNNHDFLKHPGQQFQQNAQGTQFLQQINHGSPPQQQAQQSFQQPPQQNFQQQQSFQQPQQLSQQQIQQAISQLSPSQIAGFLRSHPAVAQQLAPQQQQQPQFIPQRAPQQHQQQQQQPHFNQQATQRQPAPLPNQPEPQNLSPAKVHFANMGQTPGDYQFGYHTGQDNSKDNSFREEMRLPDGTVKGSYGYIDANGKQRIIKYTAGKNGFQVEGDIHPDQDPSVAQATAEHQKQQARQIQESQRALANAPPPQDDQDQQGNPQQQNFQPQQQNFQPQQQNFQQQNFQPNFNQRRSAPLQQQASQSSFAQQRGSAPQSNNPEGPGAALASFLRNAEARGF